MALWWVRGMGRCKQTSVCLSKPAQCVSKVYLSSRTRWQRPARIKEVGLRPTLTFSALSTWNESAPSSDVVCDIGWAHDAEGKKEQCGVVHLGQCFFFFFFLPPGWLWLHLTHQQQYMSTEEMARWLLLIKDIAAVTAAHFAQHEISVKLIMHSGSIILRVKLMWNFTAVWSSVQRLPLSLPQQTGINASPFVFVTFILIRDAGLCEMHMRFNLI